MTQNSELCSTGDTFPLGCAFDESIVHHKVNLFFKAAVIFYNSHLAD